MEQSKSSQNVQYTEEEFESLNKCYCPYSLVYDPLKSGSIDGTDTYPHDRALYRALVADYKPNKKLTSKPDCTIFVARLNKKTTEKTLKRVFSEFGVIKSCCVVRNVVTGASQRYGFIEYENQNSTELAYKRGHRMSIDGHEIIVDYECERLLPGWIPRRFGGGFCGKKESGQLRFGCREKQFKKPINLMSRKELLESYGYMP